MSPDAPDPASARTAASAPEPASARVPAWFWWSAVALVAVTFLAYSPALRGGWIWDDDYYVTRNPTLCSLHGLWRLWTDIGAVPQYYPLTHTTFWIEWQLWGDQPAGYHVANVLFHCANAILVGLLLRRLAVPGWWIVPWLFALHPVHVESVAWVTERKNVLSGFFYLLALHAYLGARALGSPAATKMGTSPFKMGTFLFFPPLEKGTLLEKGTFLFLRWECYFVSLGLFVCALLSKSVTSSLPAVVLLVVYWKRGRISWRDVAPLLPFFVLGGAMGMLTSWMEREVVGAKGPEWDFGILDRFLIAGRAVWFYATKLLWPHPLIFMYPRWGIDARSAWQYAFPLAAAGLVAALWGLRHRLGRGPLVAALYFGGTLLPALGFVNVLPMRYSFVADHFQYLASLGVLTLMAAAVVRLAPRFAVAVTTIGCIALAVMSWSHAHDFANLDALWRSTLAKNPSSWMAHNNYGTLLMQRGDDAQAADAAAEHFRRAIALKPDHDQARLNLGLLAERQGHHESARAWYLDVLRVRPGSANAYYNLANLAASQGRADEAIQYYEQAIAADPRHDMAHVNLGIVLARRGELERAVRHYRRALEINPSSASARINLGNALLDANRVDEALAEWRAAAAIDPRNPVISNNIGTIYAAQGNWDEAERRFRDALTLRPDYVEALTNLGIVRARRGDVAGARHYLTRALALDPANARARKNLDALPQ